MIDSKTLFDNLNQLSAQSNAFYSVDQVGPDGGYYRIFLYRLASYTDFLLPDGGESRGSMFRFNGKREDVFVDHNNWELVSLPPEKFFNMNENPKTMGLDFTAVEYSMVKEDGSLISSYIGVDGDLYLKTKGSLNSVQAHAAMRWLANADNAEFRSALIDLDEQGWTINMEWTSPLNRIVVPYQVDKLVVLNARNRTTGDYMGREALLQTFPANTVELLEIPVHEVAELAQGEGVVVFFGNNADPRLVKIKASAYLILHRLKDGVNQPNALFEAVVHDAIDDLRASFADDQAVQTMIGIMEKLVRDAYNNFVATIEVVFNVHEHLERKDFAIRVQAATKEIVPLDANAAFTVLMNKYLGRDGRMTDAFIKSAQGRIVAEYTEKVTEALGAAPEARQQRIALNNPESGTMMLRS